MTDCATMKNKKDGIYIYTTCRQVGIPEVSTIVGIFNVMTNSIKHLLWSVSISGIKDLWKRGGKRGEKRERERERERERNEREKERKKERE